MSDIIGFADGEVLAIALKDIHIYVDEETPYDSSGARLVVSFRFKHSNDIFTNRTLDVCLCVESKTGHISRVVTEEESHAGDTIKWSSGCWAHGGPQLLSDRFFSLWTGEVPTEVKRKRWRQALARAMSSVLTRVVHRSVLCYQTGLDVVATAGTDVGDEAPSSSDSSADEEENVSKTIDKRQRPLPAEAAKATRRQKRDADREEAVFRRLNRYHVSVEAEYTVIFASLMLIVTTVYFLHLTGYIGKGERSTENHGSVDRVPHFGRHPHSEAWHETSLL